MTNVNIVEPFPVQEIMQRSKNDELVAFRLDFPLQHTHHQFQRKKVTAK